MFIAALAHKYSFPHEPYHINIPDYGNDQPWYQALVAMLDFSDVRQDVTEHIGVVGSSLSRRLRGRTSYHMTRGGTSETSYLMTNSMTSSAMSAPGYQDYDCLPVSDSDGSSSSKNRYGTIDPGNRSRRTSQETSKNDGIKIIKQTQNLKEYTPQYGVPQIVGNYFSQQQPTVHQVQLSAPSMSRSNRSDQNTSKSEAGPSSDIPCAVRKSDSTASDWLSTPTDEFMGIDIKGREINRINYSGDPFT